MVKQGHGKIINIASLLSHQGGVLVPGYTASKHGILGLTRAMSNELAPKGVNVNSITPGYMHTDLTEPLISDPTYLREKQDIEARTPMGRWGTIEDLQGAALLLASDAGFISMVPTSQLMEVGLPGNQSARKESPVCLNFTP